MTKTRKLLLTLFAALFVTAAYAQSSETNIYTLLTGGQTVQAGKTWKVKQAPFNMRLGPTGDTTGTFHRTITGLTDTMFINGLMQNSFTFRNDGIYIPLNQKVTANFLYASEDFGRETEIFKDVSLTHNNHTTAPFSLHSDTSIANTTGYRINIHNGSYIGYYERRSSYYIARITENSMLLCNRFNDENAFAPASQDSRYRCFEFESAGVPTGLSYGFSSDIAAPFPNPAVSALNLRSTYSFTVLNQSGNELIKGEGDQTDVSHLLPGHYLLRLTDKEGKTRVSHFTKE